MSSNPDFRGLVPQMPDADASGARSRLRDAMSDERTRNRRRRFGIRSVATGVVLFTVWSIAPSTPTSDQLPLIGLAEAVAQMSAPEMSDGASWYVAAYQVERLSFTADQEGTTHQGTVLVESVRETWVRPGTDIMRRTTVSSIDFPTEADRLSYEASSFAEQYQIGGVSEEPVEIAFPSSHPMWERGPAAVLETVSQRSSQIGDVRLARVSTLRSLSALMQVQGSDPAKRRTVLLAIAMIPGIDVSRADGVVSVAYEYVVGDVAQEITFGFDESTGQLVSETVSALATPTSPEVQLMVAQFEARPDFAE